MTDDDHDADKAKAARDEARDRVEKNADEDWKAEARRALWEAIKRVGYHGELTTDDIECSTPREPKVWGPMMTKAAKAGVIEKTGEMRTSTSIRCHARPKAVWRVIHPDLNGKEPDG